MNSSSLGGRVGVGLVFGKDGLGCCFDGLDVTVWAMLEACRYGRRSCN